MKSTLARATSLLAAKDADCAISTSLSASTHLADGRVVNVRSPGRRTRGQPVGVALEPRGIAL